MAVSPPIPSILVILGPTASGKSALAMAVARRAGAEILSVDSMQVYRGMDVGTAKPTPAERAEVRHHLVDVAGVEEIFTVARFVESAEAVIADAGRRGTPLVATGGTPLYYKALFEGLFEGPRCGPGRAARLGSVPNEELSRRLAERRPGRGAAHPRQRQQAARAGAGGVRADGQADLVLSDATGPRPPRGTRPCGSGWTGTARR